MKTTPEMRARLRELSDVNGKDDYDRCVLHLLDDSEALLAALRAAEARAQHAEKYMRDWRQGDLQGVMVHLDAAIARAEAAEAERERMREALDIAVSRGCDHCAESIRKARAALQSTSAKEGEVGITSDEQKAQGARCPCHGADDYCPCQNAPDDETRKARREAK